MKNKWWVYAAIVVFVIIIFPLIVTGGVSFRIINTDTTNEWIGFWGGYMGAIIGGLVTLYVMRETNKEARENLEETIRIENQRINNGKRKQFDDEILDMSLEFYIKVTSLVTDFNRGKASDGFVADVEKILVLSKKLIIKLAIKTDCEGYQYCVELSDSVKNATTAFRETLSLASKKESIEEFEKSIKSANVFLEKLNEDIAKYYYINETENV